MVVVLSLMLVPTVPRGAVPDSLVLLPFPVAADLLVGVAIGLTGAVLTHATTMAGEIAALQMGLNLGPTLSPMAPGAPSGVGELESMLTLALFVTLGGHLALFEGVARSFHAIPPGGVIDFSRGAQVLVTLAGTIFSTAVRVAAPMIAALLLANLALAILNKAVPSLNAMALAFPITIPLGLLVLGAALPLTGQYIGRAVQALPAQVEQVVGALVPEGGR
jgi:flagellar biosynthetic protein FliR